MPVEPIQYAPAHNAQEKLQSVQTNYERLLAHLEGLGQEAPEVQRIAVYILLNHCQRICLAWQALPKTADGEYIEARTRLFRDLELTAYRIRTIIRTQQPEIFTSALCTPKLDPEKPILLVVGAGPSGCFTATRAKRDYGNEYEVVMVADEYAQYPTRNGYVSTSLVAFFICGYDLPEEHAKPLCKYVEFRPQIEVSIKHYDMAGLAIAQSRGVTVVAGKFDGSSAYRSPDATTDMELATVKIGDMQLHNVRHIIRASGFNTQYPNNIQRVPCSEALAPVRSHVLQLNVCSDDKEQFMQLAKQMDPPEEGVLMVALTNIKKTKAGGVKLKAQLYAFLTEAENAVLERALESAPPLDPMQSIMFKFQTITKCFLPNLDLNQLRLPNYLKPGKRPCHEFKVGIASAPNLLSSMVKGTITTETWVGAAALPPSLDGAFVVARCFPHAEHVLEGTVRQKLHSRSWQEAYDWHIEQAVQAANVTIVKHRYPCQAARLAEFVAKENQARADSVVASAARPARASALR